MSFGSGEGYVLDSTKVLMILWVIESKMNCMDPITSKKGENGREKWSEVGQRMNIFCIDPKEKNAGKVREDVL